MKIIRIISTVSVMVISSLVFSGCASGSGAVTGRARPMTSPAAVRVYESMPEKAEVIGTVTVTNPSGFSHYFTHPEVEMLKEEASKLGANGLVVGGSSIHMISGYQVTGIAFFVP